MCGVGFPEGVWECMIGCMDKQVLAAMSRANGGVLTRAELAKAGVGSEAIASRVESGEWQRLFRGVSLWCLSSCDGWSWLVVGPVAEHGVEDIDASSG